MATEFYDEEQAKKVYELEETMVLDDETSYFLVSCEELTRKTNLLSLAKALNGDESSENKEYKNLVELLAANSDSPIFVNNEVEIFGNGETVRQRRSGSVRRSDRRHQRDPLRRDPRGACRH